MATASHSPPFVPGPPFGNPAANVILRPDGIDFSSTSTASYYHWLRPCSLREYLDEDPVAVFAIACHHEWKDLALEAARSSLRLPIQSRTVFPNSNTTVAMYIIVSSTKMPNAAKLTSSSLRWTLGHNFPGSGCGNTTSMYPMNHAGWESATSDSDHITA
ncbi:hypothetical protein DFH09DRAFT_1491010 [Mycena vulgaris]|nr:hypothetical protein DFH09DRAFT_1491010 [Mycena vulgaris]